MPRRMIDADDFWIKIKGKAINGTEIGYEYFVDLQDVVETIKELLKNGENHE